MLFATIPLFLFGCTIFNNKSIQSDEIEESVVKNTFDDFDIIDSSREILTLMQEDKRREISDFAHPVK